MRAVEFNWLTTVDVIEYDEYNNVVSFSLEHGDSYITALVTPTSSDSIEVMVDSNPQNAIPAKIAQLNPTDVCIVGDYDKVHAISGMPFSLTGQQLYELNLYLYEHIKETEKWLN